MGVAVLWETSTLDALATLSRFPASMLSPKAQALLNAIERSGRYASELVFHSLGRLRPASDAKSTPAVPIKQLLVMPVGDTCNLACRYCYEVGRRTVSLAQHMSDETWRAIVHNTVPHLRSSLTISFHGGEPLLRGFDFFESAIAMLKQTTGGDFVDFGIQTNGTLLDRRWAKLLKAQRVSVGISLDGSADVHDSSRKQRDGTASHHLTMRGIRCLQESGIPFGVTCVVTQAHASQPGRARELFEFMESQGIREFDFHPSFSWHAAGRHLNLSPERFADFSIEMFDHWLGNSGSGIQIRSIEQFFESMSGMAASACYRAGKCTSILGVLPNGSVIPCTRPFDSDFNFGSLVDISLPELLTGEMFKRFSSLESLGRSRAAECRWSALCGRGGCPHERMKEGSQAIDGKHVYCTCDPLAGGYPAIFAHYQREASSILESEVRRLQQVSVGEIRSS